MCKSKIRSGIGFSGSFNLTICTRIGELTRAEWKLVNFERKEWTIPPEHSKNKKQFVIQYCSVR